MEDYGNALPPPHEYKFWLAFTYSGPATAETCVTAVTTRNYTGMDSETLDHMVSEWFGFFVTALNSSVYTYTVTSREYGWIDLTAEKDGGE